MKKVIALVLLLCLTAFVALPAQAATALSIEELIKILNEPGGNKSGGLPGYLEGRVGKKRAEATISALRPNASISGGGSSILGNNTITITSVSSVASPLAIMNTTTYLYKVNAYYSYNAATTCYANLTITSGDQSVEVIQTGATQTGPRNLFGSGSSVISFEFTTTRSSNASGLKVLNLYLYDSNATLLNTASHSFY